MYLINLCIHTSTTSHQATMRICLMPSATKSYIYYSKSVLKCQIFPWVCPYHIPIENDLHWECSRNRKLPNYFINEIVGPFINLRRMVSCWINLYKDKMNNYKAYVQVPPQLVLFYIKTVARALLLCQMLKHHQDLLASMIKRKKCQPQIVQSTNIGQMMMKVSKWMFT